MMQTHSYAPTTMGIDTTLPVEQRIRSFLQGASDPYHVQVGSTTVGVRYRQGGASLQQKMTQLCRGQL